MKFKPPPSHQPAVARSCIPLGSELEWPGKPAAALFCFSPLEQKGQGASAAL